MNDQKTEANDDGRAPALAVAPGSASDTDRLELLMQQFVGCKWDDCGPLGWWKPEGEKYVTRESLLARLDAELPPKHAELYARCIAARPDWHKLTFDEQSRVIANLSPNVEMTNARERRKET